MAAILQHYMVESVHNDLYNISEVVKEVFSQLAKSDVSIDGLFLNADAGFDAKEFRHMCRRMGVFANVAFNHRAGGGKNGCLLTIYCIKKGTA